RADLGVGAHPLPPAHPALCAPRLGPALAAAGADSLMSSPAVSLPGVSLRPLWRPSRMERYVVSHTLWSVRAALGLISTLIVVINLVEVSRDVGGKADVSPLVVLGLTLLKSPIIILMLLPFAFLFGVLGAFVSLNRRSELVAMRAAGMSAWRFIFPAA